MAWFSVDTSALAPNELASIQVRPAYSRACKPYGDHMTVCMYSSNHMTVWIYSTACMYSSNHMAIICRADQFHFVATIIQSCDHLIGGRLCLFSKRVSWPRLITKQPAPGAWPELYIPYFNLKRLHDSVSTKKKDQMRMILTHSYLIFLFLKNLTTEKDCITFLFQNQT